MFSALPPAVYIVAAVAALLIFAYRRSLPRPIPGDIPYDPVVAKRMFGHIPAIIAEKEPLTFFLGECHARNSPIFQVFVAPFGQPAVVIVDSREAHDILARRTREFDRATFFADLFVAIAPNNQVCLPTNDLWHANRRLMADTMSPKFLADSAAPQAKAAFTTFVELLHERSKLAKSLPFDIEKDVDCAMLDAITAIAFGSSSHATEVERDYVASSPESASSIVVNDETIIKFARTPAPPEHVAIERCAHSTTISADSPLGSWHHAFALKVYPKYRAAIKQRRKIEERQIRIAYEKFSNPEASGDDVKSATDLIVSREMAMAKKEGRKPNLSSPIIADELFGFLVAGYDTTATTIKWGLKYLTKYPEVQSKLRSELREAFADISTSGSLPSAEDVMKRRPAYLDAVIEEILRLGNPGVSPLRTATMDTTVLGHFIPKGTDVILLSVGPSQTEPPFPIDEKSRSTTSKDSIDTAYTGDWDVHTLGEFRPERWLTKNKAGELDFNPRAGPQQTFGGGLRGCFGRKLAYVMLRIMFTLVVWEFELLPLSEQLGSMSSKVILTNTPELCFIRLRSLRDK